jgi:hypothetical protein
MNVRVVLKPFPGGIVCDVEQLSVEVVFVAYAVVVITRVPHPARALLLDCKRIAALNELNALCRADVDCWRYENVDMVWHNSEAVEEKFPSVAVAE